MIKWDDFLRCAIVWLGVTAAASVVLSFYSTSGAILLLGLVLLDVLFLGIITRFARALIGMGYFATMLLVIFIGVNIAMIELIGTSGREPALLIGVLHTMPLVSLPTGYINRVLSVVSPNRHYYRADIASSKQSYNEALDHLASQFEKYPDDVDALGMRVGMLRELWRTAEALDDLERLHAARPSDPWIQDSRAIGLALLGDPNGTKYLEASTDLDKVLSLARIYRYEGRYDEAKAVLERFPRAKDSPLGRVIMGDVHRVFGHEGAAQKEYRRGAKEAKKEKLDDLRAYALAQAGDLKEATAAAEAVLEKNSRDVHALLALAVVAIKTDDLTGAEDEFEDMAEIAPAVTIGLIEDPQFTMIRSGRRMSEMVERARIERDATLDEVWSRHPTLRDLALDEMRSGQTVARQGAH